MATFDRSQLHKQVLASNSFKLFLELEPQLRDVIINFYESKYGKCLKQLDDMKDNLMLDTYLASHVNNLLSMIRSRSLVQYFRYVLMSVTWCDLTSLVGFLNKSNWRHKTAKTAHCSCRSAVDDCLVEKEFDLFMNISLKGC